VSEPILRATDPAGEVYDDPSEDALYEFMDGLRSPEQRFGLTGSTKNVGESGHRSP
jgi:hypothetical protein